MSRPRNENTLAAEIIRLTTEVRQIDHTLMANRQRHMQIVMTYRDQGASEEQVDRCMNTLVQVHNVPLMESQLDLSDRIERLGEEFEDSKKVTRLNSELSRLRDSLFQLRESSRRQRERLTGWGTPFDEGFNLAEANLLRMTTARENELSDD